MCLNKLMVEVLVDLVPDIADVYVYDIRVGIEIYIPYIDGQVSPGNDPVFIAQQVFQQLKLLGGKPDLQTGAMDLFIVEVHFEVGSPEDIPNGHGGAGGAFEKSPDLEKQLAELEGVYHIIVGPGIIAFNFVIQGAHRSKHDDQQIRVLVANGFAEIITVHPGQIDVKNDQVPGMGGNELIAYLSVIDRFDMEPMLGQSHFECVGYFFFVLHDQYLSVLCHMTKLSMNCGFSRE